jgi:hypothetical protein
MPFRLVKNFVRRQMMFGGANDLQNNFPLLRQT